MKVEGMFPWDTDEIELVDRFSLKQGERVRAMLLDGKVSVTYSHYIREEGRVRVERCAKLDNEACKWCGKVLAQPRFGANVLVYTKFKPLEWEIKPWLFGGDKYKRLRELIGEGYDLRKHDLQLYCFNETFQNMKIDFRDKNGKIIMAMWDRVDGLKVKVINAYKEGRYDVLGMLKGEDISDDKPAARPVEGESSLEQEETRKTPTKKAPPTEEIPLSAAAESPVGTESIDIDSMIDDMMS